MSPELTPTATPKPTAAPILNGNLIKSLTIKDAANAADWSIQNNLQTGDVIYGDRANTFTNVSNYLKGAEWIRMACDSKNLQSDVGRVHCWKRSHSVCRVGYPSIQFAVVAEWMDS